jgi:hypothetical protein
MGGISGNAQCVDVGLHQIADGVVDEAMTLDRFQAGEFARDDSDPKVPAPIPGAGMSLVQVALVDNVHILRLQSGSQSRPDFHDAVCVHGSTSLKGFTVTSP